MAVNLSEFAIGIVILGIVASISAVVMLGFRDSQLTSTDTASLTNQVITDPDASFRLLDTTDWVKSLDAVWNDTNGRTIDSGNYTFVVRETDGVGVLNASTEAGADSTGDWSVNYTVYNKSDPRFSISDNAASGLAEYGNWFKILVIISVAAVILTLIFVAFRGRSSGSSGGGSY